MNIGIVGNGPSSHIPPLTQYKEAIDYWIGADRGALYITEAGIPVTHALGDFDSVTAKEKSVIAANTEHFHTYPAAKNETDLELAIREALHYQPEQIYFFGVSGARLDHGLINIQLLYPLLQQDVSAFIIDQWNKIQLVCPGTYRVQHDEKYPYISFLPFSPVVENIHLNEDFVYSLQKNRLTWGSTLCISNEIKGEKAVYSFTDGLMLVIQSTDVPDTLHHK